MQMIDSRLTAVVMETVALLRARGVRCGPDRISMFVDALGQLKAPTLHTVRRAGRSSLCTTPDEQSIFDDALRTSHFGLSDIDQEPGDAAWDVETGDPDGPTPDIDEVPTLVAAQATTHERLEHMDFSTVPPALSPQLIDSIRRSVARACRSPRITGGSPRQATPDIGRTMRLLVASDGDIAELPRRRTGPAPRSVDLAIDLSGSMAGYSEALITFARAFRVHYPGSVRICAFGTVFRELTHRESGSQQRSSTALTADRGGTDLGQSFAQLARWRRSSSRGVPAVLIVFSDGWDAGDQTTFDSSLSQVRRLYRSIIWANPHVAKAEYRPVQRGIVTALAYVDHFVSGHSVHALSEVIERIPS